MKTTKILLSIVLFMFIQTAWANDVQIESEEDCRKLINAGGVLMDKGEYALALEYLTRAEIFAEKENLPTLQFYIKNNIGIIYNNLSNYGKALGYYQQALKIAEKTPKLRGNVLVTLNNIGIIYLNDNSYTEALKYFIKGYYYGKENNLHTLDVPLAINISDVYNKMGNFSKARQYLMEIEKVSKQEDYEQLWKINFAESFFLEGHIITAQKMMENFINDKQVKPGTNNYVYAMELLSKIYFKQENIPLALKYAKEGLRSAHEMKDRVRLYDQIALLFLKNEDYILAFQYKDSTLIAKDSLNNLINKGLFESNKAKLKVQEYKNEIALNKEKHQAELNLMYLGFIIFLVIVGGILFFFRQKKVIAERNQKITLLELTNKKQDNLILEKQISETRATALLETELLKNEIEIRNRKLSAKTLFLSGRNELISEIIDTLNKIPEINRNSEVNSVVKILKEHLKTDEEWDDFIAYFEQVNPNFLKKLQTLHPQLNQHDIRYLCYLYMNLDLNEISNIFRISIDACRKRKQRIAKKIGVNVDHLYDYLIKISN